ncbi:Nucleolar complex-associated protein 3 [Lasallia pustulata]|uniref:Nucleolar complex-associated protein 3 n=1 Tax=Lasallia pustulata TaxID=136370 RepID=A0A1W5D3A4_9LECA|nr:Nucleolar complex-associated protein 3 [Lasallia pustulata]
MISVPASKRRKVTPPDSSDEETSPSTLVAESDAPGVEDFFSTAARWNLEQDYEQRPRKLKKKVKENTRLPIKTAEGRVEQLQVPGVKEEEIQKLDAEVAEEKPKIPVRQQILDAKEEMARVASLINEDPEEHAGAFRTLAQISSSKNITIKKLALATQLAVYKDVIPGYRIRPLAEADMTEKVSKEVRRLRAFEQALVGSYQSYVKELARYAKSSRGDVAVAQATLATVAISCACTLLLAVPHFNFRGDLLKILVQKLSGKRMDEDFYRCRETLETLFRDDEDGTPSLDAVTLLTRMMKARGWRVDESALNTFLHLRLLSEFSSKGSQNHIDKPSGQDGINGKKPKFKKEFRTKKQRKLMKERKVVEKEFKEADATVSYEERDRMQAEILKLVFVTYFRILKARVPNLMGAVLEGLAKYAHLINQDFFGDLLEALKDLTAQADALLNEIDEEDKGADADADVDDDEDDEAARRDATRESLLCIITAFALLEGQDASKAAATLSLDLSFFIAHLYKTLYSLALYPDIELSAKSMHLPNPHGPSHMPLTTNNKVNIQTTTVLLLRSLSSILLPPASTRAVPPVRVAAFTKQLLTSSLQLPEKSALAMLGLMEKVAKIHGRKIAGMWNTEERKGDGVFDPLRGDLEGSNPYASTVWEGELLRLHYCPGVREGAKGIEKTILDVK